MDLLTQLPVIGPTLSVIVPFLLVLAIVVFVHEYGHYIVGRWCGIGADAFSVGFGPEIYGWTDSRGTRWRIGALPLGGYVKFRGDADPASASADDAAISRMTPEERAGGFHTASVERRALTVLAGPVANFLLSVAIFALMALGQGRPLSEPVIGGLSDDVNPEFSAALEPGDRVLRIDGEPVADFAAIQARLAEADGAGDVALDIARNGEERRVVAPWRAPARVDAVTPGGAADRAGLEAGDVILAVNGEPVDGFSALQKATRASGGETMRLTVLRGGETVDVDATPEMSAATDPLTGETETRPLLGIQKLQTEIAPLTETAGPFGALVFGAERTWMVVSLSISGIAQVVSGAQDAAEVLGGPVRIAEVSGDAAAGGLASFVGLIAVLSTSIGLINLFPIPVLDGGHLMFYAIEKARGRPLRPRWQEIGNSIGLALVLSLMAFATFNDLSRL
ncbi:RIP metalloprotease RseP [Rubrimonas cliftonensis]|uniref:Zinc metalloprotease n=1 Tax=Rubrimonas cliftonensis TaxID=89524 RepID=A0A1H3X2Z8_9RHOB|nr:RIP metalloprotease RseP [Rubrimonas cliftonensis]SDZ93766.1 regulator of sigma E protease [Rubrimonas cliftonensis]